MFIWIIIGMVIVVNILGLSLRLSVGLSVWNCRDDYRVDYIDD